ncbi:RSC complex protein [Mycena rebaudengoi]|nr:RSC complex protein [Mycena rebaudengoi]
MSKRELRQMNGGDSERSRPKRRREMGVAGSSSDVDMTLSDALVGEEDRRGAGDVRVLGMKLLQTVRDATNKEGRSLSTDFLRKPSKKLYPSYYEVTQHPIAIEDIRKLLDAGHYPTLEAVRQDFELCFDNAMTYNMENSPIWLDARDLLKLTNKTYNKLMPSTDDAEHGAKKPSLHRLLKSRLQKVIAKTDDSGRIMSEIFMELPSKKMWPIYYVQIKQPRCLEAILKRVKRKDYASSSEFADDVELVFSNAMTFNQEHTQIWEDALSLRNTFRELMADLPPPFTATRYQKPSNGKIKIKMPAAAAAAAGPSSSPPAATAASVVLRVPAKAPTPKVANVPLPAPTPPPAVPSGLAPNTLPSSNSIQVSSQSQSQSIPQAAPPALPPTYINTTTATFAHYPNATYRPGVNTLPPHIPAAIPAPVPVAAPVNPAPPKILPLSVSQSPAPPPIHPSHMLKGVSLLTEPRKRPFLLDHRDGVKTWVIRLGPGERAVSVGGVTYMGDDEEDSSESESESEDEEEESEDEMDVDGSAKNGKKNGKGKGKGKGARGKGRAVSAATKALQAARAAKREARKIGEVQVKLNGFLVAEKANQPGEWLVDLQAGSNLLEVGEKGGLIWKVYAERPLN